LEQNPERFESYFSANELDKMPVNYFMLDKLPEENRIFAVSIMKFRQSLDYNTSKFSVINFHRPISKIVEVSGKSK